MHTPEPEPLRQPQLSQQYLRNDELGDEIADLAARLPAADYRLLLLIREFDAGLGWLQQGARSCAHWLSWRIGLDLGAAREKVRVARALESLPRISESMSKGEISYSKVRAVTRVATPDNEEQLLTVALGGTASLRWRGSYAHGAEPTWPRRKLRRAGSATSAFFTLTPTTTEWSFSAGVFPRKSGLSF
jgi:Domain of unknown function (DUF222)